MENQTMPQNKSVEILQTFYQRMMPVFTPQAERILDTVERKAFSEMAFRYTFSVEAMTKISHIIEDAAIESQRTADFHASFQYLSRLGPQQSQYQSIVEAGKKLWLYYAPDIEIADDNPMQALLKHKNVTLIDTNDTPLVDYWFVVAYGEELSMTLLAHEVPSLSGADRYYEGFYTFEADTAYQVLAILHRIYPRLVPAPEAPALPPG
jgi:hypothetical protein